jgi:hypothetical protein
MTCEALPIWRPMDTSHRWKLIAAQMLQLERCTKKSLIAWFVLVPDGLVLVVEADFSWVMAMKS